MARKAIEEITAEEINAFYEGKQPEAQDEGEDLIKIDSEEGLIWLGNK